MHLTSHQRRALGFGPRLNFTAVCSHLLATTSDDVGRRLCEVAAALGLRGAA